MKKYTVAVGVLALLFCMTAVVLINQYKKEKIAKLSPPHPILFSETPPPADIVLFGDSRAEGWNVNLFGNDIQVLNAGLGGDVTPSMLSRLENDVMAANPSVVVLLAGINDLVTASMIDDLALRKVHLQLSIDNLKNIVARIESQNIQIFIVTITPPLDPDPIRKLVWGSSIDEYVVKINLELSALHGANIHIIDASTIFLSLGEKWVELIRLDALHYKPLAYEVLTEEVLTLIRGEQ